MRTAHRHQAATKAQARHLAMLVKNPVFKALNAKPMPPARAVDVSLAAWNALNAITHGQGTDNHLNDLAVATNLTMLLCEKDIGPEGMEIAKAAQQAVLAARARAQRHGRPGFSGLELQAVTACLEHHDAQIEHGGQAAVSAAYLEMHNRLEQGHVMEVGHG
jgi:hypothetical protein